MEESESLGGEDPRISDFSLRLITSSSLLESIFCTMVHVSTSSFKKCTISFFFEIELLYEVVLVSGVQQSDSEYIYTFFIRFFLIIDYYKILIIVSCAIQ